MQAEIKCRTQAENIYTLCGTDKEDKTLTVVTYYTDEDATADAKTVRVDFGRDGTYELYLLDREHDGVPVTVTSDLTVTLAPNTCVLIKEK